MFSSGTSAIEHCLRKDMEPGRSPGYSSVNNSQNNFSRIMYTTALQTLVMRRARYGCVYAQWCGCLKGFKRLLWRNIMWFHFFWFFFFFFLILFKTCKKCSQAVQNTTLALLSSGSFQNYFCIFLMWNSHSNQRFMTVTDKKILTFSALLSISLMNWRSNFCFFLLLMYSGEIFTSQVTMKIPFSQRNGKV